MKHISYLLKKNIKQSGFSKQIETSVIISEFEKIIKELFGVKVFKKLNSVYIKNKTLYVSCGSSVLVQELSLQKYEILQRINKLYQNTVLEDFKIQV